MRPLFRQKRMRRASGSVRTDRFSEITPPSLEEVNHLDDTVFRRRPCKVQLSIRMAEFP